MSLAGDPACEGSASAGPCVRGLSRSRPLPSTAAIGRGRTPSASASAVPRGLVIGSSISSASSQVANTLGPASGRSARSDARTTGSGTCSSGRRRPARCQRRRARCRRRLSVSGPPSSNARRRGPRRDQRGQHAVGHVLGPDRLVLRPAPSPTPAAPAGRRSAPAASARGRPACRRSTAGRPSSRATTPAPPPAPAPWRGRSACASGGARPSRRRTGSGARPRARPRAPAAAWRPR